MATANLLDETHIVNAIVRINGERISFVSLSIEQSYGQHHTFSIQLDYDVSGKSFMDNPTQQIDFIGKIVVIDFQHGSDTGSAYIFRGVVTGVKMTGTEGKHGYIILEGASPTIMLERGKRMDIYSNMTLRHIFNELTDGVHPDYLKLLNEPTFPNKIDFLMQYNETDWEFMKRIAYLYGENLFYSGSEILFGAYTEWETIPMTYDKEITSLQFCSRMLPNQFTSYQYISDQDSIIEKSTPNDIENSNTYLNKAADKSQPLTSEKPPKTINNVPAGDQSELEELVTRQKTRTASQTIYIQAQSKTYEATIGRLIEISLPEGISDKKELGTYRVIRSVHKIDQNHHYSNEFEAVPAKLKVMPTDEPKIPKADSVLATVKSNDDPKGLGRVQVDFSFANQYSDTWLRVMTPDAGLTTDNSRNRGITFIPEKGDQVMVCFEFGDSSRPYIAGSMFHGKNTIGGQTDNHIKSIITRSGHTIEFDDNKASLGITIKDNNGNLIHLDTKGQNIEITAPETITFNAKNMNINIEKDLIHNIGNNMTTNITETLTKNVKKQITEVGSVNMNVKEDYGIEVKGTFSSKADKADHASSGNYNIESGKKVIISGSDEIKLT